MFEFIKKSILILLVHSFSSQAASYIVKFKNDSYVSSDKEILAKLDINVTKRIRNSGFFRIDSNKSLLELKEKSIFSWVEPNYIYRIANVENPFVKSWWHFNYGQIDMLGQHGIAGSDIKTFRLWEKGVVGSKNIKVAVLDSGVDYLHKNLKENIYININEIPDNKIDDDKNGFIDDINGWNFIDKNNNPMDKLGHGTHVSGIIGAKGDNDKGVTGVNQHVSIVPIKVMDDNGYGTLENILEGIYYAKSLGVQIINASLGGDPYSEAFFEALKMLNENKILFVAAAGNDNMNNDEIPFYPASYQLPNIIAVAANDNRDLKADFSHYGAKSVHISAPGVLITSTTPGDNYNFFSGTSMSAPFVAGGAALLMSAFSNEDVFQIKERMIKSCDPSYPLKRDILCHGRLNLENALLNKKSDFSDPDVNLWTREVFFYETIHPYNDAEEIKLIIKSSDAKYIRIHFLKIETEQFDKIFLEMSNGKIVEVLSGEKNNYSSEPILGNEVMVRFKPDLSLSKFGFIIDYIEIII